MQRLVRLGVIAGGGLLVALHGALLLRRVTDGTFLEPFVLAQWLIAIALLFGAGFLRRRGVSLLRGRTAAVLWIVAALLHGVVALPGGPGFVGVASSLTVDALPVGAGLLSAALIVLGGFLLARTGVSLGARGQLTIAATASPGRASSMAQPARAPPA